MSAALGDSSRGAAGALPEGSTGEETRAPAPRPGAPSGARPRGRPPGSKTRGGKAPAKPLQRRAEIPRPSPSPAPPSVPAKPQRALLLANANELAAYMAKAGFLAAVYTADKPRLAELAKGIAWADLTASASRGEAVPAPHVKMAADLAWPFLLKSGILSADILSDEYRLAAAVAILAAPMVPAMWKFALYREPPPDPKKPTTPQLRAVENPASDEQPQAAATA